MRVILLGSLPPPIGGVSTHLERLVAFLKNKNIQFLVFDLANNGNRVELSSRNYVSLHKEPFRALYEIVKPGPKVLHCPLPDKISLGKYRLILFMRLLGIKITVTFVASPEQTILNSAVDVKQIMNIVKISSHVISVNKSFRDFLIDKQVKPDKISIIQAFIPVDNEYFERFKIPEDASDFCKSKKRIILTYAYGPVLHNGVDLYGLDLFIDMAKELRSIDADLGFVVIIPQITEKENFNCHMNQIKKYDLESSFYFAVGTDISFVSFLPYSNLFIRATNTDGDGTTLREALYFGIPSIASDVCNRAEGTILFENRNVNDLIAKVINVLKDNNESSFVINDNQVNNADIFLEKFYQALSSRRNINE